MLGPRSPASNPFPMISMIDNIISGADDPSAISVRFDTVSFQMRTHTTVVSPSGLRTVTSFSFDVITSMAAMNRSAMMETPRKRNAMAAKYTVARATLSPTLRFVLGRHIGMSTPSTQPFWYPHACWSSAGVVSLPPASAMPTAHTTTTRATRSKHRLCRPTPFVAAIVLPRSVDTLHYTENKSFLETSSLQAGGMRTDAMSSTVPYVPYSVRGHPRKG